MTHGLKIKARTLGGMSKEDAEGFVMGARGRSAGSESEAEAAPGVAPRRVL